MRAAFRYLPLILLLALALRVLYAWEYRATHSERAVSTIPFLFEPGNIAASLANGNGFSSPLRVASGPTAWMAPVYPLLLAGVFRVFGPYTYQAWLAAVALNIAFGVLTCVPIFLSGRRAAGPNVGACAAWLWAVFPNALILPVEALWDASLAALLGACAVSFTVRLAQARKWTAWAGYGLLWGSILMVSPTLALALPFLLVWLGFQTRSARMPAVAAGVAALCCVPWTLRNYEVMHAWIPLRSVSGVSLWMGTIDPALGQWPGSRHPLADAEERERYLKAGEIQYMEDKKNEAVAFWRAHPLVEARLSANRLIALWAGGSPRPWSDLAHPRSLWFEYVLAFNLALAFAALTGLVRLGRSRSPFLWPLAAVPVITPFAFYVTLASARYRLIVDPEVMLLAAAALALKRRATPDSDR